MCTVSYPTGPVGPETSAVFIMNRLSNVADKKHTFYTYSLLSLQIKIVQCVVLSLCEVPLYANYYAY